MTISTLARKLNVFTDNIGIDPLRDKSIKLIENIVDFRTVVVSSDEEFNIPLLSYNYYNKVDFWWVIMAYNGLISIYDLRVGIEIMLPNASDVLLALSEAQDLFYESQITSSGQDTFTI